MSATMQQSQQFNSLGLPIIRPPDPNAPSTFVMPEEGWNKLYFTICRVVNESGESVAETRQSTYQGKVREGIWDVRLEFHVDDPATEVTPWKKWISVTLGERSRLRPIVMAIRKNKPLDHTKQFDLAPYESKPFLAFISIDEVPARDGSERLYYFANIVKCKPVGGDDDEPEPAKDARPKTAKGKAVTTKSTEPEGEEDPFPEVPW